MADQIHADPLRSEQRCHERLPLEKNVLLIARGMKQRACVMKDVCAGGALLEVRDEGSRSVGRGEVVLMRMMVGEGEAARPQELRARIAHADAHRVGVSFFNPDPAAMASLLAAAAAPAPAPEPEPEAAAASGAHPAPPRSAAEFLARAGLAAARPGAPVPGIAAPSAPALRELLALVCGHDVAAGASDSIERRRLFAMLKAADEGWRPALSRHAEHAGNAGVVGLLQGLLPFADALLAALAPDDSPARVWLARLELPLLHALASDAAFCLALGHPLRRLLDALARLGARDAGLASATAASIDGLVAQWMRDFDGDPAALAGMVAQLEPQVAALDLAGQHHRERVCAAAAAEQRLADARHQVQEALDSRLAGRRVPQPVLTLLEAGWRELLVATRLREGGNRDAYLGVLDELLAVGANPSHALDLRALLQLLKQGLAECGELSPSRRQQVVAELKPLLTGASRLKQDKVAWVMVPARAAGVDRGERWLGKWLERAARLQPGDCLALQHRGGAAERLCLAWRNGAGERFVFVNRQGLKAADLSRQELASLLHSGNALVCGGPLAPMEQALQRAGAQLYERLVRQATHDELTGLANRAEFMRQLERALEAARRSRGHHVLARISLDQFPELQSRARAVAFELLRSVAQLLGKALAPRMQVARLGDGEFALLLEDCEIAGALHLFSMRLGELAALRLNYEGEIYALTASAGLVDITYTSESAPALLHAAGIACDEARRHGGNRIEVYRPTDTEQARRDALVLWVARISEALEAERLALRCQRIQALAGDGAALGFEVLLGLPADAGETPPPGEFVQAAERYQRMLAVDRWVIEHTFRWLRDHPEQLARTAMVSLNLSAQSLGDAQTPGFIFERLLKYRLPPEKFCFEVSEAAALAHRADTADFMHELHAAGCRFALENVGTGCAGGEHLHQLPLDFVKIDGAFVRALGDDAGGDVLLRAINALAHYAGLASIAENVEDDATLAQLRAIGVDYAQGYGIEKPRSLGEGPLA